MTTPMRASEALMLGSMTVKPLRGHFYSSFTPEGPKGCALGMISVARYGHERTHQVQTVDGGYPWMLDKRVVEFPCGCHESALVMGGGGMLVIPTSITCAVQTMIVHLFNQHVIDGDWTIERLADWIESVDPTPKSVSSETAAVQELVAAT